MNYKLMLRTLGRTLQLEALCLLLPLVVCLIYREDPKPFLYTIGLVGLLGSLLVRLRARPDFFSREVSAAKSEGDCSARAMTAQDIKRALREIIEGEEKKKPYSDRILGEKLAERGISISRRTVAKYREEEGIPDASGRKEYL